MQQASRRFANNQLGINRDHTTRSQLPIALNEAHQRNRSHLAHLPQRLANRSQRRMTGRSKEHIVETHNRDIARHLQTCLAQRSDSTNSRNIIEAENSREGGLSTKQLLHRQMTRLRSRLRIFELHSQFWMDLNPKVRGHFPYRLPATARVGTERLALDESDALMSKL